MYDRTMTDQALFILASLAAGELHGYAIAHETEELSDGMVRLSAGTLYGALARLCEQGLIAQTREEHVGGRKRRYYALTADGVRVLQEETARVRATAEALRGRVALNSAAQPDTA